MLTVRTVLGGVVVAAVTALTATMVLQPAWAATPQPVHAPARSVADPGVLRDGGDFYAYTTGPGITVSRGDSAETGWRVLGNALDPSDLPSWVERGHDLWAPDVWRTPAGYVLYYSAVARNFGGQRCIGAATSESAAGPFTPRTDGPLVCPGGRHGADDPVPGRPLAGAGVIDPSPFRDVDGKRYLLYKTQQMPSTLRMVRLNENGLGAFGESRELVRDEGIIENPVIVKRGDQYVLFASRFGFDNCSYATVWLRSSTPWDFSRSAKNGLLSTAGTGICGPGGADVTPSLDGGYRIFLHGWVCGSGSTACTPAQMSNGQSQTRRSLYAAVLHWDGATPRIGRFL